MKAIILVLAVFASTAALAQQKAPIQQIDDEPQIQYISWCEDNKVVFENEKQQLIVQADCNQYQMTCTLMSKSRLHLTQFFAYCAK